MKRRKEFHLFPLGILLFTLTLTIVSGRIAIHAADLNTELPANDSTEISSEIPTETPVVPSTENPKPVLQGLIHDKNGHFYFYQNGKKLEKGWQEQILFREKRTGSYREKEYFPLLMLL